MHVSGSGTEEASYYTAIDNLLDCIGETLKPKVRCVMQLKSLGAGNLDGGLFTVDQFDRKTEAPRNPATPSRGVIEVKAPAEAVDFTGASAQVAKYWDRYRLGHSDFATQRPLLQDLFSLLKASLEPRERLGLDSVMTDAGAAYWRIK